MESYSMNKVNKLIEWLKEHQGSYTHCGETIEITSKGVKWNTTWGEIMNANWCDFSVNDICDLEYFKDVIVGSL